MSVGTDLINEKKKRRKRKNQEVDKMIEILWNWKCVENLYRLNIIGGKMEDYVKSGRHR